MKQTSFDKAKIKILLLEGVHQSAIDAFSDAGYTQIESHAGALSQEELIQAIKGAHIVGIRSRTQLNAEVLAAANKLMVIGCFCIGTNQVDLLTALTRGIAVFNAPFSNTRSVAELVIAEAILLLRGIPEKNALAHEGKWLKSAVGSYEIRGKTLGIVGYGNIGTQVSVLAESIGMRVLFHDAVNKLPLGNATQTSSLKDLLAASDVVTLHVPEDSNTRMMMGPEQLAQMKPGAVLINASRGTVVDIDALATALENRALAGAAIDVFPSEPKSGKEEFISPLRAFSNCILTPHVGGSTMEAQDKIGVEVAEKLIKFSDNGTSLSSVNFPEVTLPAHPGGHRILHIHQNVPGVLSKINNFFADHRINIRAQYLQTVQDVGYVVTDIDEEYSAIALAKLQEIDGTLRTRVLF
ncbi:MAG: phosphoglycerate dehydrogenase [SAR86 cluster bacterium]|jgi:D-3-phosphoglycerate dehydrogenase / 2-oxoglutarate reductase|uniref:D-3-phosphoglycerate dehydrogenase n=1 Tax=SAR86 cluster bacterium TaxID=2030880 RepID=A0A972VT79_9GAMM|nr:phosphoglycerate dehydrogenase [SAR86 cluster bacterium]|tara:strand:- start:557 stop:1786 length:1230 start_codon:yes stop_codon:yes gene_type:complete